MVANFISKNIGDISIDDPKNYYAAPDCSIIRKFPDGEKGGFAHVTLPPRKISKAAKHKTVEELWYCVNGEGKFWRKSEGNDVQEEIDVRAGTYFTIEVGVHFQFKNEKDIPLEFVIVDIPVWPGPDEADISIEDHWSPTACKD